MNTTDGRPRGLPCAWVAALVLDGLAQAGGAVEPLHIVTGSRESAAFGLSIAGVGDVDGDGRDDFVAGESFFVNGAVTTGRATELPGHQDRKAMFGYSLSAAGDADGDGRADLLIGAPGELKDTGVVRVYSGTEASQ